MPTRCPTWLRLQWKTQHILQDRHPRISLSSPLRRIPYLPPTIRCQHLLSPCFYLHLSVYLVFFRVNGFQHRLGMESIKIPSSLDPDNPASARGNPGTQKPKQTKSRNGKLKYVKLLKLHISISIGSASEAVIMQTVTSSYCPQH